MGKIRHQLSIYLPFILVFLFWGIGLLAFLGYKESFLWLNQFNSQWLDLLFPHITHLADGILIPSIFIIWAAKRNNPLALTMLIAIVVISILVFLLKNLLFQGWNRPLYYFKDHPTFHYVSLETLRYRSFPSGHSAAAATCLSIVAFAIHKRWEIGLAFLTVILAYSRVYLGVHFLGDIIAGTFLGLTVSVLMLIFFLPKLEEKDLKKTNKILAGVAWALLAFLFLYYLRLYQLISI